MFSISNYNKVFYSIVISQLRNKIYFSILLVLPCESMEYREETSIVPSKASFFMCALTLQEPIPEGYVIYQNPTFPFSLIIILNGKKTESKHRFMIF